MNTVFDVNTSDSLAISSEFLSSTIPKRGAVSGIVVDADERVCAFIEQVRELFGRQGGLKMKFDLVHLCRCYELAYDCQDFLGLLLALDPGVINKRDYHTCNPDQSTSRKEPFHFSNQDGSLSC